MRLGKAVVKMSVTSVEAPAAFAVRSRVVQIPLAEMP